MELGLTGAKALAHLFAWFHSTPSGAIVVAGGVRLAGLDSLSNAIRAVAPGDARVQDALRAWTESSTFGALASAEAQPHWFVEEVERFRTIMRFVAGSVDDDELEATLRAFCDHWQKAVLGDALYAKDQLDRVRQFSADVDSLAMSKEDNRYVAHERTTDERRAGRGAVERVLAFLQTHGEVVPHASILELNQKDIDKLLRRLGETALATMLVAKERRAAFLADDVITRVEGHTRWQLPSIGTQGVLLHLRNRGKMTHDEYLAALVKLSDIGYHFLRVGAGDLFSLLKREGFSLSPSIRRLFRSLEGPECDDESSAQVVAELLQRLYAEAIVPANVAVIVDFLCASHATGRDAGRAMGRLKALTSVRLRGQAVARAEVTEACDRVTALDPLRSSPALRA